LAEYRLVILDFDGTLADSLPWLINILNDVARRYRFRQVTYAEIAALRNNNTREILRYMRIPRWKYPFIAKHVRSLSEDAPICLFPDAATLLRELKAQGYLLAIVSSNSEKVVRRVLGLDVGAVTWGYATPALLAKYHPRFLFNRMEEIPLGLKTLIGQSE
jgi:phosphoglycolate phosphatase